MRERRARQTARRSEKEAKQSTLVISARKAESCRFDRFDRHPETIYVHRHPNDRSSGSQEKANKSATDTTKEAARSEAKKAVTKAPKKKIEGAALIGYTVSPAPEGHEKLIKLSLVLI